MPDLLRRTAVSPDSPKNARMTGTGTVEITATAITIRDFTFDGANGAQQTVIEWAIDRLRAALEAER